MFKDTILRPVACDLRSLPLGATEAFMLSQVDGTTTLEEIAQVVGLEFSVASKLARKLVDLGVVTGQGEGAPRKSRTKAPPKMPSQRMQSVEKRTERPAPRKSSVPASNNIETPKSSGRPGDSAKPRSSEPLRKPSRKLSRTGLDDACDLDDATRDQILSLEASLSGLDHYELLGIERDADKKGVKRAVAALAGKYHPDRFFGKKLGRVRAPLDRIFQALTRAHDSLVDLESRRVYDASLPPAPPKVSIPAQQPPPTIPSPSFESARPRRSSAKMTAVSVALASEPTRSAPPAPVSEPSPHRAVPPPPLTITEAQTSSRPPTISSKPPADHLLQAPGDHLLQAPGDHLLQAPGDHLLQAPGDHLLQAPFWRSRVAPTTLRGEEGDGEAAARERLRARGRGRARSRRRDQRGEQLPPGDAERRRPDAEGEARVGGEGGQGEAVRALVDARAGRGA